MAFETLSPRLLKVATKTLAHCRENFGRNGYRYEEEIAASIAWRPTFFFRPNGLNMIAVEVADKLYPEILKQAAHDIGHFDTPITVYQACPLDVFQADSKQHKINLLRDHGFGIFTVDDDGRATRQYSGIPLAQNLSLLELEARIADLTPTLRAQFRGAHDTYHTNVVQGLQQASQIVEGLIRGIADQAFRAGLIAAVRRTDALAGVIDRLWDCPQFRAYRGELGTTRGFVRNYRNAASHPADTPRQAVEKIRRCRAAFLESMSIATDLRDVCRALGYQARTFVV